MKKKWRDPTPIAYRKKQKIPKKKKTPKNQPQHQEFKSYRSGDRYSFKSGIIKIRWRHSAPKKGGDVAC